MEQKQLVIVGGGNSNADRGDQRRREFFGPLLKWSLALIGILMGSLIAGNLSKIQAAMSFRPAKPPQHIQAPKPAARPVARPAPKHIQAPKPAAVKALSGPGTLAIDRRGGSKVRPDSRTTAPRNKPPTVVTPIITPSDSSPIVPGTLSLFP